MWTFFWSFACYSILQNYWFVLNFKEQKWQADPGHTTPAYCGALVDIGANSLQPQPCLPVSPLTTLIQTSPDLTASKAPLSLLIYLSLMLTKNRNFLSSITGLWATYLGFLHLTSLLTQHQSSWLSLLGSLEILLLIWSGHSLEKVPEQVRSYSGMVLYHPVNSFCGPCHNFR